MEHMDRAAVLEGAIHCDVAARATLAVVPKLLHLAVLLAVAACSSSPPPKPAEPPAAETPLPPPAADPPPPMEQELPAPAPEPTREQTEPELVGAGDDAPQGAACTATDSNGPEPGGTRTDTCPDGQFCFCDRAGGYSCAGTCRPVAGK